MNRFKPLTKVAWIWHSGASFDSYANADWHRFRKAYYKSRWKKTANRELKRATKEDVYSCDICDGMILIIVKR